MQPTLRVFYMFPLTKGLGSKAYASKGVLGYGISFVIRPKVRDILGILGVLEN